MNRLDISEMEEIYKQQNLGKFRIGFGKKPALVIIDFQYGLTDDQYGFGGGNIMEAAKATASLLSSVRSKGIPVFYSVTVYRKDLLDAGLFVKKVRLLNLLVQGSRTVEIDDLLKPEEDDVVIQKHYPSVFDGTNFDSMLNVQKIDTLLITGCVTGGCVRATAMSANGYGYRPMVVEDCVGDRSIFWHRFNLLDMDAKIADVVKLTEVFDYLNKLY
jgi:nicotinamidase-related amidase